MCLIDITRKLILECGMPGILITIMDEISIGNDQAMKWAKARVFVYADSVLCPGKIEHGSKAEEKWKGQLEHIHHIKMQLASMEKQWSSSGQISQDFQHCPFFKRSRKT